MASVTRCDEIENGDNSDQFDEKKDRIVGRIQRRQQERIADLKKKQKERESRSSKNESVQYFVSQFGNEKAGIETRIESVNTVGVSKAHLLGIFDELTVSIQKLQKFVTDSALFLSSYEVRHAQEEVTKLQTLVTEKRDELMPKKKFAFKARKKAPTQQINTITSTDMTDCTVTTTNANLKTSALGKENCNGTDRNNDQSVGLLSLQYEQCGISNKTNKVIELGASEINGKDVGLTNLTCCKIRLHGCPSAVHMDRITDCKIFCGPVPGSIFVDNCKDSTLVLSCQQLRLHHTKDTHFYLHVTSRCIIEDTTQVQFSPYNWTYPGIEKDYEKSELNQDRNNWDDIDDFNWLASDKRSPNWSLIPENERIKEWDIDI